MLTLKVISHTVLLDGSPNPLRVRLCDSGPNHRRGERSDLVKTWMMKNDKNATDPSKSRELKLQYAEVESHKNGGADNISVGGRL